MTMPMFVNTLVSIVVLGSIFSLVTLGFVIVYRSSHVFNFMHPQFMLIGALVFTTLGGGVIGGGLMPFATALVASVVLVALLAAAIYTLLVHRAAQQPHWIQMIMTMGLGIAAVNIAQLVWGGHPRFPTLPFQPSSWALPGGGVVSNADMVLLAAAVALNGFFYWLLTRSRMGLRLKATSENPALSAYAGIRLLGWFSAAWALAAGAAVIGAVMYTTRIPLEPSLADVGLMMFPAAMMGGMDSIKGAFVGAFILAAIRQFSTVFLGAEVAVPLAFGVVLVILVFRPRGLFGTPVVDRV